MDSPLNYEEQSSKKQSFPLWKWIVELILGVLVFFVLYVVAQSVFSIPSLAAKFVISLFSSAAILLLFLLWTKLFEKSWRFDLLTKAIAKNLTIGILIGAMYFVVIAGILTIFGSYSAQYASPHWSYITLNLFLYFLVACGEEVTFRGIIFRMIDERFGIWWALGVSALLFGFVHIFQPNASVWSSIAIAIEAGVLLGAAFKFSGSLWLPIGIHWAWNFTQGNVFGFSVSGTDKGESILNSVVKGPDLVTGGDFGPEASVVAVALGTLLSAIFIWQYQRRRQALN